MIHVYWSSLYGGELSHTSLDQGILQYSLETDYTSQPLECHITWKVCELNTYIHQCSVDAHCSYIFLFQEQLSKFHTPPQYKKTVPQYIKTSIHTLPQSSSSRDYFTIGHETTINLSIFNLWVTWRKLSQAGHKAGLHLRWGSKLVSTNLFSATLNQVFNLLKQNCILGFTMLLSTICVLPLWNIWPITTIKKCLMRSISSESTSANILQLTLTSLLSLLTFPLK